MRIGLLSDTHGHFDERMAHHLAECDEIWHAGDVGHPSVLASLEQIAVMRGVYGNIDGTDIRKLLPEVQTFEIQGLRVAMIHIAGPFGRYNAKVRELIKSFQPAVLICGHSHILKIQMDSANKLLFINPGAAGKHGFHKVRTMCRFRVEAGRLEGLEIVELGPRSSQAVN